MSSNEPQNKQKIEETDSYKFSLMIIPGINCFDVKQCDFYYWLFDKLKSRFPSAEIILKEMPEPDKAPEILWIPFIKDQLKDSEMIYLVGHSSGAVAIMRILEDFKVQGAVLVGACVTHLNDEVELKSGYYPKQYNSDVIRPWRWDLMKQNTKWLINFSSEDDPYVENWEFLEIEKQLNLVDNDTMYHFKKEDKRGHFESKEFEELYEVLCLRIESDFKLFN